MYFLAGALLQLAFLKRLEESSGTYPILKEYHLVIVCHNLLNVSSPYWSCLFCNLMVICSNVTSVNDLNNELGMDLVAS